MEDLGGARHCRRGRNLAPNLPLIIGHRGQLQEVLINLVRNAIEAMSDIRDGHRILHVKSFSR